MDQFGTIQLSWTSGYTGTTVHVIDDCTLCFVNANSLKFYNLETRASTFLLSPGDGIGVLTVNAPYRVLAFSDNGLRSKIYVYNVNALGHPESTLEDDARKLGYTALTFANNGSILASCSHIPEVTVAVWNWVESVKLCSVPVASAQPFTQLSFNPLNWRQLCGSSDSTLSTWTIEQINESNILTEKKCYLPLTNGELAVDIYEDEQDCRSSTGPGVLRLTKSSIAAIPAESVDEGGLSREKLHYFDPGNEAKPCMPEFHCWAPDGQIICGCAGGQLLVADAESSQIAVLHLPKEHSDAGDPLHDLQEGCFNCIVLHKNGLFTGGKDGVLRCLKVDNDEVSIVYSQPIGNEIKSLQFSPNYQQIAVGSSKGSILVHDIWKSLTEVINDGCEKIVGLSCLLQGNQYCVTCREDGLVQTWAISNGDLCGQLFMKRKVCALVCPASSSSAMVGTSDGAVVVIDCGSVEVLRCVHEIRVHKSAITCMRLDNTGRLLFTGSNDNNLFIIDTLLTTNMNVIGYTIVPGDVMCVSCISIGQRGEGWKLLAGVSSSPDQQTCNHLVEMTFKTDLLTCPSSAYMDSTRLLKDAFVKRRTYLLKNNIYDVMMGSKEVAYAVAGNKNIVKFVLPDTGGGEKVSNMMLEAVNAYSGHSLVGGKIQLSVHQQWLLSCAPDGYLTTRDVSAMESVLKVQAGNYRVGGLQNVVFSGDAQRILSSGTDGALCCWNWEFTSLGKSKAAAAIESFRDASSIMGRTKELEDKHMTALPELDTESAEGGGGTWLEAAVSRARAEEDKKYTEQKAVIRSDFSALRERILEMMRTNDKVPEIEHLDRQEFVLDVDEIHALSEQREETLRGLSEENELENVAKQFVRDVIKQECWNQMDVKGMALNAFNLPINIVNYPMRHRTPEELEELKFVQNQRELELIEMKTRAAIMKSELSVYPDLIEAQKPLEGEEDLPEEERTPNENPATYGSLGFAYGGRNSFLHSQFAMHNSHQKRHQITLLKDCVYNIKVQFNKNFDEVFKAKEVEIKRVNERNVRINKITKDLEVNDSGVASLYGHSNPSDIFEVRDDEIIVEKYITPEEQARLDELDRIEQERLAAERADNIRGRALEQMMAGRLETNTEEELKKDIVPPEFVAKKSTDDWTEDEQKEAKEFEKKQTERKEEREKWHKSLETELKKLQTSNVDGTAAFDEKLQQLFQRKIKSEMVINQEELKVLRLVASVMIDEELEVRENELLAYLEEKKVEKQQSSVTKGDAKREVEAFRDEYDLLLADDRMLDKMFRREFTDIDTHTIDTLYRLYKRRPRAQKTLKAAHEQSVDGAAVGTGTVEGGDPFVARPSSSRAASAAVHHLADAMQELDDEVHMPDNIPTEVWHRFVALRRGKVEKEQQVKAKALVLAEMNAYLQRQIDKDEAVNIEVENTFHDIQSLREERLKFNLNLEVQLVLKQGQVEVPTTDFIPDFNDSILIHRSAVEDLNATINVLGSAKLASMRESKEFRKGIHQLEWELKEMFMKAEDFQTAARDLQLLRVTKELQAYLSDENHQSSKQQEIQTLEKTLEVYKNMQKRNISDRQRIMRKLTKQISAKEKENQQYDEELEEMSLSVVERGKIDEVNADQSAESGSSRRMQDIITRRKLVDLAKAQAQEIAVLRAEVERLRMRTFPALTQLDQQHL